MGNVWKLLFVIWLGRGISAKWENFTEEVYGLTNEIMGKYFQVFKCVTYVSKDVRNGEYLRRVVPLLVINLSVVEGESMRGDLLREGFEQGCGGVIVQTEAGGRAGIVRALVEAKSTAVSFRYNRERYLFLPVSWNDTRESFLWEEKMFFLPNLLFVEPVVEGGGGRFLVKGHRVFEGEKGEGGRSEVVDVWRWGKGFEKGRDLYPDKIRDVGGKELVLGLMHYVPYSVIVKEGNKTIYDGVESRIAEEFVKSINGHEADLGYSAIYQWYCDVLDCSYPYIQAEVVCLVPKPRIITSGMTILLPFSTSTWIGFFVAYIISSSFVLCITFASRRLSGRRGSDGLVSTVLHSAFNIFRLQLNQVPRLAFGTNSVATFVKIALFYHFSLSVFWQGGIASILTVPRYEKAIDTAEDLVSRWPAVKWGANHDVWIHSIENSTEPVLHEIVKKFLILDEDTLVRKTRARNFAFFMEKLPNKHYGFSPYINEDTVPFLRLMKSNIYTGFAVMILPRGSPYTEKLDNVIHWLFATGITQKIEYQVSLERINNHLQIMIQHSDEKEGGKAILTLAHLKGPLYIYFGGTLTATATFVAEKLIHLKKWRK